MKVGDVVMMAGGPCVVVSVETTKARRNVYLKSGRMLDLVTGRTFEVELDDVGVRGEILRAP